MNHTDITPVITANPAAEQAAPTTRRRPLGPVDNPCHADTSGGHLDVPLTGTQMSPSTILRGTFGALEGDSEMSPGGVPGGVLSGTNVDPTQLPAQPQHARVTLWTPRHRPYNSSMSSALRKTGSTREWRRLRIPLLAALARNGYLNCAAQRSPRCLRQITRPQDLVAGHVTARSAGGTDAQLQPECRPCSDHQGGVLAHQPTTAPERKW